MLAKKTPKMKCNREIYKILNLDYKIKVFSADLGEDEGAKLVRVK